MMQLTWIKALRQLGIYQTSLFAFYQFKLRSGYLRWVTKSSRPTMFAPLQYKIPLPDRDQLRQVLGENGLADLLAEADEIVSGKVRLFGGPPVDLELTPPSPLKHWTLYRNLPLGDHQDIKFIWEPGRFGWAITLARAYLVSQDERYPEAFWKYTEFFLDINPVNLGVHWISAQEVALRLTSVVFASHVFRTSPHTSPERVSRLAECIAQHAMRIPPTLTYARAQNNNHLLTEAMGLITAASVIPSHPLAKKWQSLGWKWFHEGLKMQIDADGNYRQHSTNYHRLMLQTALWVRLITNGLGLSFPKLSMIKLAAATNWLLRLLDPMSGHVPNLGPNDGAYIFPFSALPFEDYRPILQASSEAFLGGKALQAGLWDEMGFWLCNPQQTTFARLEQPEEATHKTQNEVPSPCVLQSSNSWAYLRCARFSSRPGHADQLHLDLWWRGLNLALDPGTYLYNAPAPWDNALTSTFVHNTVTIDLQEQMRQAGRFLYLDWAQAEISSQEFTPHGLLRRVVAAQDGYRSLNVLHQRTVEALSDEWRIEDMLLPAKGKRLDKAVQARLHWMLPDWEWEMDVGDKGVILRLLSPKGWVTLQVSAQNSSKDLISASGFSIGLFRAGQVLASQGSKDVAPNPTWGWVSPTYGVKIPALSFSILMTGLLPLSFLTTWDLRRE